MFQWFVGTVVVIFRLNSYHVYVATCEIEMCNLSHISIISIFIMFQNILIDFQQSVWTF